MVHEIWIWITGIVSYAIGFGCGIWFTLDFLKMIPSLDVEDEDIF